MRILAVHGIGHCDAKTDWQPRWNDAIAKGLATWSDSVKPEIEYLPFDTLFQKQKLNTQLVARAVVSLTKSGLFFGLRDLEAGRGFFGDALEATRWTAGMVAQWVALDELRAQLRALLTARIRAFNPNVILAHSLGSLIAYDTLRSDEVATRRGALSAGRTLLTFGSQIGNPAVRATFGGRIEPLEAVTFWWHLYNAADEVFTVPITMPSNDRFRQVDTYFNVQGIDHDGALYLGNDSTTATVWQDIAARAAAPSRQLRASAAAALPASAARRSRPTALAMRQRRVANRKSRRRLRALLVGIAEYADPQNALEGPVNDVFSVSAVLQELGFDADDIRIVLNDRATAQGIRERLKWLLSDPREGDQLVFFFAGHGAQIPSYGSGSEVDRIDECLVPYDFDWTRGQAITDDEFAALYAQLPYGVQFTAVLDCCHSGGMVRAGGVKARGITPPDDIRHRSVRWDKATQMWVPRRNLRRKDTPAMKNESERQWWLGESGAVQRLGRGTSLWLPTDRQFRQAVQRNGHLGPYTPILLEACRENELAYEYRHGVVSFGAFTFTLCETIREGIRRRDLAKDYGRSPRAVTFAALMEEVGRRINKVVAEPQHPQINCAKVRLRQGVPGLA